MVTTQARSSTSPPDRAGSPAAQPDRASSPVASQGRAPSPPAPSGIIVSLSATIPNKSNIFRHVLTNVLRQPTNSSLIQALDEAGINQINDLLTLDHQLRNALMYKLNDGTVKPLPIGYKKLLRVLKIFVDYCQDKGMPIDDWTAVTKRDFDDFRTSCDGLALSKKSDSFSIPAPTPVIAPTPSTPTPKQKDRLSKFKKGIKWDALLFIILKDLKQWDSWHQSTVAQACTQNVYDVLDPAFKPSPLEKDLFEAKQRYMYAVFERVLQTIKERHWSDPMSPLLMLGKSSWNCVRMPYALLKHPLTLQDSFPMLPLLGLEMAFGMELCTVSFSTGRNKFDCMNP